MGLYGKEEGEKFESSLKRTEGPAKHRPSRFDEQSFLGNFEGKISP